MKKGNVMFWKCLFLGFIVCFPVQAQENANSVSERNNYELFIICVAIYLFFKAVGVIWHYRCPKCKKWWVMRQEKKELLNTDVMTESRKEEIKDNNGNVQLGLIVTSIEVNFIPSVFKKLSISFFSPITVECLSSTQSALYSVFIY